MVSKAERKAARRAAQASTATTTVTPPTDQAKVTAPVSTPSQGTVKILKPDAKFGGARLAWFNRLKEYDGKDVAEYEKSAKEKPPSLPTRGKNAGKAESPMGWVSYFKRTGIAVVVPPQAPQA